MPDLKVIIGIWMPMEVQYGQAALRSMAASSAVERTGWAVKIPRAIERFEPYRKGARESA